VLITLATAKHISFIVDLRKMAPKAETFEVIRIIGLLTTNLFVLHYLSFSSANEQNLVLKPCSMSECQEWGREWRNVFRKTRKCTVFRTTSCRREVRHIAGSQKVVSYLCNVLQIGLGKCDLCGFGRGDDGNCLVLWLSILTSSTRFDNLAPRLMSWVARTPSASKIDLIALPFLLPAQFIG
jgi:hypothetical protein